MIEPRRLEGRIVVLEPLEPRHEDALRAAAAAAPEVWQWMQVDASTSDGFERWYRRMVDAQQAGTEVPFASVLRASGEVVGGTRFLTLRPEHRGVEIGHTWLVPSAWNTGANKEAKLLQLEHAFERCGCVRVEFKTDARNERSRRALAAIPAQFEGILRKHMDIPAGWRDSAYYSVLDDEWPEVKRALAAAVAQANAGIRSASS